MTNTQKEDTTKKNVSEKTNKEKRVVYKHTSVLEKALTEKAISLVEVPEELRISDRVLKKIAQFQQRESNLDAAEIIRLADAPQFLTMELNVELGFTTAKLLKIAKALDPRIVIDVEGEIFLDRKLLRDSFLAYLQKQKNDNVLRMSRMSRAGLRRNIILREAINALEEYLKSNPVKQKQLTESINEELGSSYKKLGGDDILAFLESYRINAEKRRIKAEEAEQELLALEELDV